MKTFYLVMENNTTFQRETVEISAREFSAAVSKAYVKRHNNSFNGSSWNIVSLSESGWNVIKVPKKP